VVTLTSAYTAVFGQTRTRKAWQAYT